MTILSYNIDTDEIFQELSLEERVQGLMESQIEGVSQVIDDYLANYKEKIYNEIINQIQDVGYDQVDELIVQKLIEDCKSGSPNSQMYECAAEYYHGYELDSGKSLIENVNYISKLVEDAIKAYQSKLKE